MDNSNQKIQNENQESKDIQNQETKKIQDDATIIDTGKGLKDGRFVCPNCGAPVIKFSEKEGKLQCPYCDSTFDGKKLDNVETDLKNLTGTKIGAGAKNINKAQDDVVTLKCGGCGAEVVIDTASAPTARCHWCRSIMSINSKIENGSVPDVILPFKLTKEEAKQKIDVFVKKRQFFAHPIFKKEFTLENVMGVYFPYMLVDVNAHSTFKGEGEHQEKRYNVGTSEHPDYRYDAKAYHVERDFDLTIDDLTVESSSDKLDKKNETKTNNIINSVMPFDTENCIQYRGNYLVGYTSEKRDVDIDDLNKKVNSQIGDIARHAINNDLKYYDRGIRWSQEDTDIKGKQWLAAYLPIWLYSYRQVLNGKELLHYVAVNARTGETMGSIPINKGRLLLVSAIVEIFSGITAIFLLTHMDSDDDGGLYILLLFTVGFIYYGIMYAKYRNQNARHAYEKETKTETLNVQRTDTFIEDRKRLKNARIEGANNTRIEGEKIDIAKGFVNETIDKYLNSQKNEK